MVTAFDHEHVLNEMTVIARSSLRRDHAVYPGATAHCGYAQDKRAMRAAAARQVSTSPMPAWSDDRSRCSSRPYVAGQAVSGGCMTGRGVWFLGDGDKLPNGDLIFEERVTIVHEPRRAGWRARRPVRCDAGRSSRRCSRTASASRWMRPGTEVESHRSPAEAQALAVRIADELEVVGVLAVELFDGARTDCW